MNRFILPWLAAALCLSGCTDKSDRQLAEQRYRMLNTQLQVMQIDLETISNRTDANANQMVRVASTLLDQAQQGNNDVNAIAVLLKAAQRSMSNEDAIQLRLDNLEKAVPKARQMVSVRSDPPTKDGVPISVYNAIAAHALERWPDSYQMQETSIQGEVEAYKKLHP